MPSQVIFALTIEAVMVLATSIVLMQPRLLFGHAGEGARKLASWIGMLLLCLTFCWSFIAGCILTINDVNWRL